MWLWKVCLGSCWSFARSWAELCTGWSADQRVEKPLTAWWNNDLLSTGCPLLNNEILETEAGLKIGDFLHSLEISSTAALAATSTPTRSCLIDVWDANKCQKIACCWTNIMQGTKASYKDAWISVIISSTWTRPVDCTVDLILCLLVLTSARSPGTYWLIDCFSILIFQFFSFWSFFCLQPHCTWQLSFTLAGLSFCLLCELIVCFSISICSFFVWSVFFFPILFHFVFSLYLAFLLAGLSFCVLSNCAALDRCVLRWTKVTYMR